jgi:GNAT superfamily N-acetyltransferase
VHGYEVSNDPERLDVPVIHRFLSEDAYWCPGISRETVERSIAGSLPFGLYAPGGAQAGFARVVTDGATFGWIGDLFVLAEHRGKGLGKRLVEEILGHPGLQDLRQLCLRTADAHALYRRFGFDIPPANDFMTRPGRAYGG